MERSVKGRQRRIYAFKSFILYIKLVLKYSFKCNQEKATYNLKQLFSVLFDKLNHPPNDEYEYWNPFY